MAIRVLFLDFEMFEVRFRNVVGVVCGFFFSVGFVRIEHVYVILFGFNVLFCC